MTSNKFKLFCYLIAFSIFTNISLNAQLKDSSNQCDYLIIAPLQFVNPLQPFVSWRQQKSLNVKVVELQQIYLEFPDSGKSYSIRDFVSYALTYWNDPKPQYLLLVGGIKLLPSYRVKSWFANYPEYKEDSVSIDEWYSVNQFDSDTKPDIALGRFPVNNEAELNNIITKTINFEDSLLFEDYPRDFIFLTDKTDSIAFEEEVKQFIYWYLPSSFSHQTIFAGQDSTIETTRNHLFSGLSEGTLFLSYYGHGAPYKLSKYSLFTFSDIDSLKSNIFPFIYTAAACSQSFDLPDDSSIAKKLIVLPKSGTVASIASTGLNYLIDATNFLSNFYNNIFNNPNISIGKAVLNTKNSLFFRIDLDAMFRRYTLLGDPALKIPFGIIDQVDDISTDIQYTYLLKQNYPNPFNPSTIIEYSVPKESFVTIKVYNILGQEISTLVDEEKQAGNYQIEFNGANLASGIYLYKMKANNFVQIKKFVLTK